MDRSLPCSSWEHLNCERENFKIKIQNHTVWFSKSLFASQRSFWRYFLNFLEIICTPPGESLRGASGGGRLSLVLYFFHYLMFCLSSWLTTCTIRMAAECVVVTLWPSKLNKVEVFTGSTRVHSWSWIPKHFTSQNSHMLRHPASGCWWNWKALLSSGVKGQNASTD